MVFKVRIFEIIVKSNSIIQIVFISGFAYPVISRKLVE
jgi:hypothetical protein